MEYIPRVLANKFSAEYAGQNKGFSAREITDYFTRYSNLVKPYDHYGINPTRSQLFIESLYALKPKQQYYALNDLTFFEYECRYTYPSEEIRNGLREELHNFISPNPVGLKYSTIRETAFREDWVEAYRNVSADPPGAITAARTLLETILKTIISERGGTPDNSGDLGRLVRQTEEAIGFQRTQEREVHQILSGFASVLNGIATISNQAGDRHGTIGGVSIENESIAELCVNACGTIGLIFIELHLLRNITQNVEERA